MQAIILIEFEVYKMHSPGYIELFVVWQSYGRWAGILDSYKGHFLLQ
jgi:hypothetical protein